jgi:ribosomal-protein-alanine N-acetyltransferase
MITQIPVSVRSVEERDRKQLANLIHFETYVHRHLDWRPPLDWVGRLPYLVAEGPDGLLAALVCPPDPPDVAWVRLFAVSSDWNVNEAWKQLWLRAQEYFAAQGGILVAAIPLQEWFHTLLKKSHFERDHNIVILVWERNEADRGGRLYTGQPHALLSPAHPGINIRPANVDDLPAIHALDAAAFGLLWRNSLELLQLAFNQSAVATVAEDGDGILGYQISTASPMGGHLARLAVHPQAQGQGIGYALVHDLLGQFMRRGAMRVTVNTQEDNLTSLGLYRKAGFRKTGEVYPVYQFQVNG